MTKTKQKFILGYESSDSVNLTLYADKKTALFESEEWCEIEAVTIEEAMLNYEATFLKNIKQTN